MKNKQPKQAQVAIYAHANYDSPFGNHTEYYRRAYDGLHYELLQLGITPIILFLQDKTYLGKGRFNTYWRADLKNGKTKYTLVKKDIQVPALFDKCHFRHDDILTTSPKILREICRNKYLTYLFLPKWHAPSYLIRKPVHLDVFKLTYQDKLIALKELSGHGGKKVFVGKAQDYHDNFELPLLAQEFLDTSIGIPGLCKGYHDLRVIMLNGEIISLLLRQPQPGKYRSNLALGGNATELDISLIPSEVKEISQTIDRRFNINGPRFIGIDFGYTNDGWRIIEVNNGPGLGYDSDNEKLFTRRLARILARDLSY